VITVLFVNEFIYFFLLEDWSNS